jgi:hypothetical protein
MLEVGLNNLKRNKMKNKETLEEASEIEYGETKKDLISDLDKIMYKCYMKGSEFGAKWQQEQNKKLYSEEDMIAFGKFAKNYQSSKSVEKAFEQFKKK